MRINEGDLDIYWNGDFDFEGCLIVARPEFGAASYIAASGIVDIEKPDGYLITKYHFQDVFNHIPEFETPGWPLYRAKANGKQWLVLIIDTWRPLTMIPGDGQNTWIYSYPIVRDFSSMLKNNGIEKLCYMTATSPNDSFPPNVFPQPKRSRTYEYHFGKGRKSTAKAFLLPPTWMFPYFFTATGGEGWVAFTGYKEDVADDLAAETLAGYLHKTLGFVVNKKHCERAAERIREEDSEHKNTSSEIKDMMSDIPNGKNHHMWG